MKKVSAFDQAEFDQLASHPLQSWAWGEFKTQQGQKVVRFFYQDQGEKKAAQVFFHDLPFLPFSVGYFPKGNRPTANLAAALKKLARQQKAIFIKLEPNVKVWEISSPSAGEEKEVIMSDAQVKKVTKKRGLRPGKRIFTKHTMIIDLTRKKEDILMSFHAKTRYNVRLAKRKGVVVRQRDDKQAFASYWRLMEETTKRQGFYAHDRAYHERMWQIMHQAGMAHLLCAEYQGEVLAAWIIFKFGDTLYYPYGASSGKHREVMASNRLMWAAILFGKENGCCKFDLWGTPGPHPKRSDPWYGFHRFKLGYDPKIVAFMGTYDLVARPWLYKMFGLVDKIRWQLLKLKSSLH